MTDLRTFLDVDDADLVVFDDDAADCVAGFVRDAFDWGAQSEGRHGRVSLVDSRGLNKRWMGVGARCGRSRVKWICRAVLVGCKKRFMSECLLPSVFTHEPRS